MIVARERLALFLVFIYALVFFFSSRRRHTRFDCDWSSDVCSSDLVAAWTKWEQGAGSGERVVEARIVLGGVASWPQEVPEAGAALAGTDLSDEAIAAAADAAYRPAKPMDNTDFDLSWRKQMTRVYVARALAELRQRRRAAQKTIPCQRWPPKPGRR